MRAAVLGMKRRRKLKIEQFSAVELATLGHLICGLYPSEINRLNPYNLRSVTFFIMQSFCCCSFDVTSTFLFWGKHLVKIAVYQLTHIYKVNRILLIEH